ncbi:hypothetical protein AUJ95_06240 [Candidatus Desantisbacteria bacterium CG2_30_40_21]|uniref:Transcriptional regulator n=4 Tax=unclassified Candidatus Desantisiibacteriota TaxID=3106372 RepID=A0A2M7P2J3_9BACT|nr:MAG: hypothetical protein AUJ95_06240 [Candidatus Desantisbacteria bacterium CG2_30_40_21]PIP41964.1 MAG: transcriptional regulator [Candidatus Desantisbacteria bacterium CG23_combo_of_CG06-09_8_20_14_all_40_23]PIY19861.1 MAG: transcriptional regulator [Candidatus Desantisbacteria bacterium CG_4_10_14_3_um_filter_40_18]PJB28511.1 MAG: transcriptional regulator [Candidatus Desantisbacteria bacterium CG_4_9_14_3_um_filter_40_11]
MKEELTLFKALSNQTRLRIMVLLTEKEHCVCQLEWALGLIQAKVSRHLTVLKNAEIVQDRRDGLWVFYSLTTPRSELEKTIHNYLKDYFPQKYDSFKKDIAKMKECEAKPLEELCSIRR